MNYNFPQSYHKVYRSIYRNEPSHPQRGPLTHLTVIINVNVESVGSIRTYK